jgi:uncharacterized protein (TIGR03118 family)
VISEHGRSAPADILFATEDGTITAWSQQVDRNHALVAADNSANGAVYKALTLGSNAQGSFVFATNFHNGTVDVFDSHFHSVHLAGSFTDPNLPAGFAPFGIKNINGTLFVTYAKQDADRHDDVAGVGNGFIDEFNTNGQLIARFASQGALNSPHGMAAAPANFGVFSNALLVGNFGDGRINAFDLKTGKFLGQLSDAGGHPLANAGIWGMTFGNGAGGTHTNTLYFVAGINGEKDGLLGAISLVRPRGRGPVAGAIAVTDLIFAQIGGSAERLANTDQNPSAVPSTSDTVAPASYQVAPLASEKLVSISDEKVTAQANESTPGQPNPFTTADLWPL